MTFENITNAFYSFANEAHKHFLIGIATHVDPLIEKAKCSKPDEQNLFISSFAAGTILLIGGLFAAFKGKSSFNKAVGIASAAIAGFSLFHEYVVLNNYKCPL